MKRLTATLGEQQAEGKKLDTAIARNLKEPGFRKDIGAQGGDGVKPTNEFSGEVSFTVESGPTDADRRRIREEIDSFNQRAAERDGHEEVAVFARSPEGEIMGGLLGGTYWGWLHIEYLWVSGECRTHGIGTRLLQAAEREAMKRGCGHAHVETHDFQAPGFYARNGYREFARLDDLPKGHVKVFLMKKLEG
jgi:ribosomal protein S18 acetylase RimI-like enzyme